MAKFRRASGLIAAILVIAMGAALTVTGAALFGIPLVFLGLIVAVWQAYRLYKTRPLPPDPYDLSRLWEHDPYEPIPEETLEQEAQVRAELSESSGTLYCHNCGHAVPDLFAHCPECGQRLR